jgi:type I restriction enzyme R subunit
MNLNESIVEAAALEWFGALGYAGGHGPQLAPGEPGAERASFGDVVLVGRLRAAMQRLNPTLSESAHDWWISPMRRRMIGLSSINSR